MRINFKETASNLTSDDRITIISEIEYLRIKQLKEYWNARKHIPSSDLPSTRNSILRLCRAVRHFRNWHYHKAYQNGKSSARRKERRDFIKKFGKRETNRYFKWVRKQSLKPTSQL